MAQGKKFFVGLILAAMAALSPAIAPAQDAAAEAPHVVPIPLKRVELVADFDMPGGDLKSVFDSTLQACIRSCLGNESCEGLTYNTTARSCFPKDANAGAPQAFKGAISGRVWTAGKEQVDRAEARTKAAAEFIFAPDLQNAIDQANSMAGLYPPTAEKDPATASARAEAEGKYRAATEQMQIAVARGNRAEDWANLARLMWDQSERNGTYAARDIAATAINAYIRAQQDTAAATALATLSKAYEKNGRGNDGLHALQLAEKLDPNSKNVKDLLKVSLERNGMRVTDTQAEYSGLTPRYCITMSSQLDPTVSYADFIKLPAQDMAVSASGSQLCLSGLTFGQEMKLTLRTGLPAKNGDKLLRDIELSAYIRDRDPMVRFPGRAYVLPAGGDQGLSVTTVNVPKLDLTLLRISDRNLLRTMAEGMFAKPLDSWQSDYFAGSIATEIWHGTAETAKPSGQDTLNKDLTTRLAIPKEAGNLEPGIYILQAMIDGESTEETGIATQWFVISDYGISTFSGTDGLTVAIRSLADTSAKAGVEVALISQANEVLARAKTDDQGIARFAAGLTMGTGGSSPALITATNWTGEGDQRVPSDQSFLSLNDPEFDLSDRGVEGLPPAPAVDVFATTDRGAYRAGETINATILARTAEARGIDKLPLTAVLIRPDGVEQARVPTTQTPGGGHVVSWTLPGSAARGTWRMEVRAEADGPALATSRVLVEDFLPERIDFSVNLPEGPAKAGQTLGASLDARWLFGAPAANLPVEGSLTVAPQRKLQGYDGYEFGRYDDDTQPTTDSLAGGETDPEGKYATDITLPSAEATGQRPVDAKVTFSVREGAGRPVERSESRLLMPDVPIIGIRQGFEDGTVSEGSEARFSLISIGPDLKPAPATVRWALYSIDTRYEWYSSSGSWNWEPITTRSKIAGGTVEIGTDPVEVAGQVDWGGYDLVVESDRGAASSTAFYAGWGAPANGETETPDRLKVALDKPAYRAGDTAKVNVEAISDSMGIVSVLSGKVISQEIVALKQGENTLSLPVTDDWGAGAYVTVNAIRPIDRIEPGDRMPVRAIGLAHAKVDPGDRALSATLTVPAEIRPRQDVKVTLKVEGAAPGDTVNATIAAVDQGILNLTKFTPPDPSKHYFGQRRLGVGLRDLYGRLILPSGAVDGKISEGGDAQVAGTEAPPPTEKLMTWFSGPLTLGADGTVEVSIPVTDFNGEIRVMAVVWSDKGVGQTDATILSRDPVVMTVTAPAFLAPGDHAQIGLRLTHTTGPTGEAKVALADNAGSAQVNYEAPNDPIVLNDKQEVKLAVPITAADQNGVAKLKLTLTTPGGDQLTKDIAISVAMNEPEIQRQDRLAVAPGSSLAIPASLTEGMMPGASVSVAVGGYGMLDVAGALSRLERYPYGCTEQITSVAMPLLYLPRLSSLEGIETNNPNPTSIETAIAQILTRQSSGGSFGLWYPDSGDLWLDSYVTDFLSRARTLGHEVPDRAFKSAIDNMRNRVNYATAPDSATPEENAALAYALAVLARERAANIGDLRYFVDTASESFTLPMAAANLGSALASYGDQQRADKMFRQAYMAIANATPEEHTFRTDYGTTLRDMEATLALAAEAKSTAVPLDALTREVAERIAQVNERRGWMSTQESLWSVLAAQGLAQGQEGLLVNGVALTSAVAELPKAPDTALANSSSEPIQITLTATGQPVDAPKAGGKGYNIVREYRDLDGNPVDVRTVKAGTRLVTLIRVWSDTTGGGRLLISDPLPAGFEIDNPHLLDSGDVASLSWLGRQTATDMAEFRQDRFAASLTWTSSGSFELAYMIRAVTPGEFRHPAAFVEDMYRPDYRAWTDGSTVTITP